MSLPDPRGRFQDILDNVARIRRYTTGMNAVLFAADDKTADAVERCLARISEAAVKLGEDAQLLCPGPPWRDIRGLGNHLRHAYKRVELTRIWLIVEKDLPPLETACRAALERLDRSKA